MHKCSSSASAPSIASGSQSELADCPPRSRRRLTTPWRRCSHSGKSRGRRNRVARSDKCLGLRGRGKGYVLPARFEAPWRYLRSPANAVLLSREPYFEPVPNEPSALRSPPRGDMAASLGRTRLDSKKIRLTRAV